MLLKQFASRSNVENDKHFVWQMQKDSPPVEISTKDAAVEKKFYGETENLESAFIDHEANAAETLKMINSGHKLSELSNVLRKFVWTQSLRTKAIKDQFHSALTKTLAEFTGAAHESKLAERIRHRVISQFDELIASEVARLPLSERIVLEEMMSVPGMRKLSLDAALKKMTSTDVQSVISRLIATIGDSGFIGDIISKGLRGGLLKLLENPAPPEGFAPDSWHLVNYPDHTLFLGDVCTFAADGLGNVGSLQKFGMEWRMVFLPIAHNQLLVGTKEQEISEIDPKLVNWASAGLSQDKIFCSMNSDSFVNLQITIGTIEPLVSLDEIQEIAERVWMPEVN